MNKIEPRYLRINDIFLYLKIHCLMKMKFSLGKEILVPLTGSMYVPGKLVDTEKVLIDIGTGYFAEVNVQQAKEYFKRRVVYVTEQMEKIQFIGQEKSKIREATVDVMEMKVQALKKQAAEK